MSCGQTLVQAQDRPVVLSQVQRPAVVQQTAPVTVVTGAGAQTLVDHVRPTAVAVDRPAHYPVEVVTRGPKGDKGDPGGTTFQRPASAALSALRVVYESEGAVAPADPADEYQVGQIVGLTVSAAGAAGVQVDIQSSGAVDDAGWSWTDGPVFLGADGALTQTPPTAGWEVVVGWPLSPTRLNLTFDEPILL